MKDARTESAGLQVDSSYSARSLLIYTGILLTTMFLMSSCSFSDDNNASDTGMEQPNANDNSSRLEQVTASSPLQSRFDRVEELVHEMPDDGMAEVKQLFPDLQLMKTAAKGSEQNIVGMGPEDWLYSEEDNITVIVCNSVNTPAYIFAGKTLSDEKLEEVKQMMAEMMEMMEGDHSM